MAGRIDINEIVNQDAIDQVKLARTEINELSSAYVKMAANVRGQDVVIFKADGIKESETAIRKQREALSELDKIKQQLITTQEKLAASETIYAQALAEEKLNMQQSNAETKNFIKERNAAAGSVDQMEAKLVRLRKEFGALSESMRLGGNGQRMLADIQKLDSAIKMAKFSTGDFTKNVGNYQSATFQLTQVLRELPAFANSAQTGIMGISNNLPILTDAFQKVRKETGSAWQALKIFGSSLFSFGNIFAVAVGLLTFFADDLFASDKAAKQASKSVSDLANAQDTLNMAINSSDYKKAVTDVNELRINIDLAKKGIIDKKDVLNEYNKTLGDTMGKVSSLDEAEKMLVKNGDAYIQMTLLKAAANLALDKAAEQYLKAELKRQEDAAKLAAGKDADGNYKPGAFQSFKLLFSQGLGSDADNFQKQTKKEVDGIQKEGDKFKDIASGFQKSAAEMAKSFNMRLFGNDYDTKTKKDKTPKVKPEISPNLSDTDLADLKKYYENLRKAQIEAMGQMINDPESKKVFDEFLLGDVLSGDQSVTDAKAADLIDAITKRISEKAKKKEISLKFALDVAMINDIVQMATEALSTINDIQYQREIAAIDAREKRMQDSYDADVKRVNASFTNQADKERELTRLEAIREAQKKKNDRDRISADRKRAQQQKAYDIASIITSTSLAVIKAYTEGDPYTKVGRALLAGSAGAIALARAASAPIPQYADGTDNHPGGPALVGEAGTERVTLPDGTSFLTNGPMVLDLPQKTVVTKKEDLMKEIFAVAFRKMAVMSNINGDSMTAAFIESIEENTSEIKALRKDVKASRSNISIQGDFNHYMHVKNNIR